MVALAPCDTVIQVMMMLLQLEMYQSEYHYDQPQQQQSPVMVQPTGPFQPVVYVVPAATAVCESYNSRQSIVAGIILVLVGIASIISNIIGITCYESSLTYMGDGIWCGVMVG